jgi:hypothetical protein
MQELSTDHKLLETIIEQWQQTGNITVPYLK